MHVIQLWCRWNSICGLFVPHLITVLPHQFHPHRIYPMTGAGGVHAPSEGPPPGRGAQEQRGTHGKLRCLNSFKCTAYRTTCPFGTGLNLVLCGMHLDVHRLSLSFLLCYFHVLHLPLLPLRSAGLRVVPQQPDPAPHLPPVRAHRRHLSSHHVGQAGARRFQVRVPSRSSHYFALCDLPDVIVDLDTQPAP